MQLDYITLTPEETSKLLAAGSGDAVLLFLYYKASGDQTLSHAAAALRMDPAAVGWAETLLKQLGLLTAATPAERFPREKAPTYSGEAVAACAARDPSFALLQGEVSRRLGRVLTTEELKILLELRDYLKMPPEVVSMVLSFCLQRNEILNKLNGTERTVSIRAVENEAFDWANRGILTLETASAFMADRLEALQPESQVKRLLHIDHPLVESEKAYIHAWLNMGFSYDAIEEAYEKTIVATGHLAWRYLNKVLTNWHEQGRHTAAQVRQEPARQTQPTFSPGQAEKAAVSQLQKFRESLKEG